MVCRGWELENIEGWLIKIGMIGILMIVVS